LVLPAGVSLPKELRVSVERKYAWKHQVAEVGIGGVFSFPNLPLGEPLVIHVSAAGLQLDPVGQTLQRKEDYMLGIFLDKRKTEIKIPMMKKLPPSLNRG
jgi:hypothetical protein